MERMFLLCEPSSGPYRAINIVCTSVSFSGSSNPTVSIRGKPIHRDFLQVTLCPRLSWLRVRRQREDVRFRCVTWQTVAKTRLCFASFANNEQQGLENIVRVFEGWHNLNIVLPKDVTAAAYFLFRFPSKWSQVHVLLFKYLCKDGHSLLFLHVKLKGSFSEPNSEDSLHLLFGHLRHWLKTEAVDLWE